MRALSFLHCLIEMLHAYSPPCLNKVHKTPNGRKESYGIAPKINPPLRTLLGPGPSPVNPRVLQSLSLPVIGHLDPVFLKIMDESMAMLRELFQTKNRLALPMFGPVSST